MRGTLILSLRARDASVGRDLIESRVAVMSLYGVKHMSNEETKYLTGFVRRITSRALSQDFFGDDPRKH